MVSMVCEMKGTYWNEEEVGVRDNDNRNEIRQDLPRYSPLKRP
jgi:hypothetical protein